MEQYAEGTTEYKCLFCYLNLVHTYIRLCLTPKVNLRTMTMSLDVQSTSLYTLNI